MKKIIFAVQVFGLIAMLPVYLILELNRGTERLPANNSTSVTIEKQENNNILSNLKVENENTLFIYGENMLLLK